MDSRAPILSVKTSALLLAMTSHFGIPLLMQPVIVIEKSALTGSQIIIEASRKKLDEATMRRIKSVPLCEERWSISHPVIYIIEPSMVQVSQPIFK